MADAFLSPYNPTPEEYERDVTLSRQPYQPYTPPPSSTVDRSVNQLAGLGQDLASLLQMTPRRGEQIGNYWKRVPWGWDLPPALLQPGTGKDIELRSDKPPAEVSRNRRAILTQLAGGK